MRPAGYGTSSLGTTKTLIGRSRSGPPPPPPPPSAEALLSMRLRAEEKEEEEEGGCSSSASDSSGVPNRLFACRAPPIERAAASGLASALLDFAALPEIEVGTGPLPVKTLDGAGLTRHWLAPVGVPTRHWPDPALKPGLALGQNPGHWHRRVVESRASDGRPTQAGAVHHEMLDLPDWLFRGKRGALRDIFFLTESECCCQSRTCTSALPAAAPCPLGQRPARRASAQHGFLLCSRAILFGGAAKTGRANARVCPV